MLTTLSLWLPILVATLAVFLMSFLMWMVLPHHRSDWKKLPDEEALRATLRAQGAAPGQYAFPCGDQDSMKDPEFIKRYNEGPSGMMVIRPPGGFRMGKNLAQSATYNLVVSIFVAYVASFTLTRWTSGIEIFRLTSIVAFLAYAGALAWSAVWWARTWSTVAKEMFDGLVYGCVTGIVFALLWP